jgi:hypothetical protein
MKIRRGFVSNSSSTSFSVPLEFYKSTADVALAMIPFRDGHEEDGQNEELKAIIKQQIKDGIIKSTTQLSFPSCNYHTFIIQRGYYYLISTCNNHPFWEVPHFQHKSPPEALALVAASCNEDLEDKVIENNDFWFITRGVYGQQYDYNCPKCFMHYIKITHGPLNGKLVCPYCIVNEPSEGKK